MFPEDSEWGTIPFSPQVIPGMSNKGEEAFMKPNKPTKLALAALVFAPLVALPLVANA
jgi:hypothetical protein